MDDETAHRAEDGLDAAARLPTFAQMLAYWQEKAAGRRAPRRAEVDPLFDLPLLAPDMLLWDVAAGADRYVCRLAGTRVCAACDREFRGARLGELPWEEPEPARREFDAVTETLMPSFAERALPVAHRGIVSCRRLLLPLSEDGRRATMLWGLVTFASARRRRAGLDGVGACAVCA
jgi:hypothetical protein